MSLPAILRMCLYSDADKFINHETNSAIKTILDAMRRKAGIFTTKLSAPVTLSNYSRNKK